MEGPEAPLGSKDEPLTQSIWSLYIITCADGSYYTGITTDIERRFAVHQNGGPQCAKYLRGRGPLTLSFHTVIGSHGDALRTEYATKQLTKKQKSAIIAGTRKLPLP